VHLGRVRFDFQSMTKNSFVHVSFLMREHMAFLTAKNGLE